MNRIRLFSSLLAAFALACGSSGGPTDGGTTQGPDGGTMTGHDGGTTLSCAGIFNCMQSCMTQACQQSCVSEGSSTAQQLFDTTQMCFVQACPQTPDGGPCADVMSQSCTTCVQNSQSAGGVCASDVNSCESDTSGSSGSTGGTTGTGTDGGSKLNCVGINNCVGNCSTPACQQNCVSEGTSAGQSLFDAVQMCFQQVCPQTDGGQCANVSSSTCTMCVDNSQAADGGMCFTQVSACEKDMSH